MTLDWITILGFFCIGQCLLLALIYFFKESKKLVSSYLLIALLLIFSFDLIHDTFVHSRIILQYPFFVGWASLFTFIKGPIIFFLVKSNIKRDFKFHRIDFLHLVVFFFKLIENIFTEIAHDREWKIAFLEKYYYMLDFNTQLVDVAFSWNDLWLLHPITYLVISLLHLFKKGRDTSIFDKKGVFWIRFFVIGYFVLYMLNIGLYIFSSFYPDINQIYWGFSSLQFSILIIIISYSSLNTQFYTSLLPKKTTYKSSNLTIEESLKILTKLDEFMIQSKPYLEKRLSLSQLSNLIDINSHHLSQVINENKNLNFQDYINQYRIEEAKNMISTKFVEEYTLESLSSEVGFNSSPSFYRAFKKFTSLTPAQYLKNINL